MSMSKPAKPPIAADGISSENTDMLSASGRSASAFECEEPPAVEKAKAIAAVIINTAHLMTVFSGSGSGFLGLLRIFKARTLSVEIDYYVYRFQLFGIYYRRYQSVLA